MGIHGFVRVRDHLQVQTSVLGENSNSNDESINIDLPLTKQRPVPLLPGLISHLIRIIVPTEQPSIRDQHGPD
jgi:hypothetical protein